MSFRIFAVNNKDGTYIFGAPDLESANRILKIKFVSECLYWGLREAEPDEINFFNEKNDRLGGGCDVCN